MGTTTQAYIELLEKTNQQLSFWYLPYETGIAVLTIGFTFVLWRQSSDYKKILNAFIEEQKKYFKEEMANSSRQLLDEHVKQLEDVARKASGDVKDETENIIATIKQGMTPSYRRESSLTEAQLQSILALLGSFGADVGTIKNVEHFMRGNKLFPPHDSLTPSHLTKTQIQAILSLLASFGAGNEIIYNVERVLNWGK